MVYHYYLIYHLLIVVFKIHRADQLLTQKINLSRKGFEQTAYILIGNVE